MTLCSALLHFVVSLGVLLVFCLLAGTTVHMGTLLIPVILLPLILLTLGLTWLFASLGVYIRDLAQGMGIITTVLLFLSPVFYPVESLPLNYQRLIALNPLTHPILQLRDVMLWGRPLHWGTWAIDLAVGAMIAFFGFWWFQKTRRGFADVL
jgi:lipopolysaccharide transport system permease protein